MKVPHLACQGVSREFVLEKRDIVKKQKPEKPLEEDGGKAPGVRLPLWSYKSKLLTAKAKA